MNGSEEKALILVAGEYYERGKEVYDSIDDFRVEKAPVDEVQLADMIREKQPLAVVIGPETYSGELYESMEKGGILARYGVGYDGVDIKKANEAGLIVTNTPGVLEASVAEHTVFLAGEIFRMPGFMTQLIKNGQWNAITGTELRGKTWAVLGLGNIGKEVSRILSFGFGVKVTALKKDLSDREKLQEEFGVEKITSEFSEVVEEADIISLHLPANEETHHFINKERLHQLKKGAVFLNTARGSLVDENALYDALKSNHLAGAGLDVFQHEPYQPLEKAKDLRTLSNVVLTPHTGSNTDACSKRITQRVLQNIRYAKDRKYDQMDIVS